MAPSLERGLAYGLPISALLWVLIFALFAL